MKWFKKWFKKNRVPKSRVIMRDEIKTGNDVMQEIALRHFKKINPNELTINVKGVSITPLHNQSVLDNVAADIIHNGFPHDEKENNIHLSNYYVYHSLKAGAEKQGVPFPDSPIRLFHYIDLSDYHKIIVASSKVFNFKFN